VEVAQTEEEAKMSLKEIASEVNDVILYAGVGEFQEVIGDMKRAQQKEQEEKEKEIKRQKEVGPRTWTMHVR
jgi:hypothetical protein